MAMLSANLEKPIGTKKEELDQFISAPPLDEQAVEQSTEDISNTLRCAEHMSSHTYKTPRQPGRKAFTNIPSPSLGNGHITVDEHPSDRRLGIPLTYPVEGIPHIKLLVSILGLSTVKADHQVSKKDQSKLHPTWVSKPRRGSTRKSQLKTGVMIRMTQAKIPPRGFQIGSNSFQSVELVSVEKDSSPIFHGTRKRKREGRDFLRPAAKHLQS
ncbi:hypothetical protein FOZG_07238 [Fusarium oxysporum Fo47]|uniref:Uncharacterized protein n=1 Tax=Fusarium oxysporum Fo47 TaxID=660027 RepID=W9KCY2_FUSOX|nr:hypothetical protein FOZG_07238 [Fusarium oxysporum Fo47]